MKDLYLLRMFWNDNDGFEDEKEIERHRGDDRVVDVVEGVQRDAVLGKQGEKGVGRVVEDGGGDEATCGEDECRRLQKVRFEGINWVMLAVVPRRGRVMLAVGLVLYLDGLD